MEFVRGLHNIKPHHRGCILTIGNFDGFHRGHQSLISILNKKKGSYNVPIMVMIFEPQPQEYLSNVITTRLTRLRDKIHYLFTAGVDIILCMQFNRQLASVKAYSFIKKILIYKLGIRCICIGDFRFGSFRQGDFSFLQQIGKHEGFQVICANTCLDRYGQRISSTAVRTALTEGRIIDAELLMGHSYCISGKVIHGSALGRMIGFPTANIYLQGKQLSIQGVYAVKVYGISNLPLPGIANIGIRPTIADGTAQQQLEVHVLNISENLYYYNISVVFLSKIRDEKRFHSVQMLKRQIQHDVLKVHNYFRKNFKHIKWNNVL